MLVLTVFGFFTIRLAFSVRVHACACVCVRERVLIRLSTGLLSFLEADDDDKMSSVEDLPSLDLSELVFVCVCVNIYFFVLALTLGDCYY